MTLPVLGVVAASTASARAFAILGLLLAAAVVWHAIHAGRITGRRALRSFVAVFATVAALSGVAAIAWDALADHRAPADIVASFDDFDGSALWMIGVIVLTVALAFLVAHRITARRGPTALLVGSLGLLAATHVLFFLTQPLSLPTTTWPLIAASCAVVAASSRSGAVRMAVLAVTATPSLLLLVPQLLIWIDSPSDGAAPPVAVTALLLAALAPQLLEIARPPTAAPRPDRDELGSVASGDDRRRDAPAHEPVASM